MAATTTTTATHDKPPLRKRMRVLERAHSLSNGLNSPDAKILPLPELKHSDKPIEETSPQLPTDYETGDSHSESSDDEEYSHSEAGGVDSEEEPAFKRVSGVKESSSNRPSRPSVATRNLPSHRKERSPMSPNSRAWYEFDLAVVVALVSPIGNWLTGGDHIKNLLLIVLLIFYLHQIIEVPWALYQKSRPRHRPSHIPSIPPDSSEARFAQLATSELKKLELFFLVLTIASPFLGAALLRYVSAAVLGPDAVSWFNTGLFVLATGMRPWAHIVERFKDRAEELNDFIHYPSNTFLSSQEKQEELERRIAQLEKSLDKVTSKVLHATEEVYGYVDNAVDAVEHAMKKQERRWDKCDNKVKQVEEDVVALKSSQKALPSSLSPAGDNHAGITGLILGEVQRAIGLTWSTVGLVVPRWLVPRSPPKDLYHGLYANSATASSIGLSSVLGSRYQRRPVSGFSSPVQCLSPLETIVEEDPDGIPVVESWFVEPSGIVSGIVYRAGYIIMMPLRAVVRMVLRNY